MSLRKKTVHGMAWVTLTALIVRIFETIAQLVLARLLDPADFGLIAIGLLVINTMAIFRDMGFGAALVYRKEDPDYIAANTVFVLIPIFATILLLVAYLFAPYIATFFGSDDVTPIIRVLALTFLISSFGTVPSMLLEKELEFKKKVIPETLPRLGYAIVAIIFAYDGYGVWSLVYGQITSAVLTTMLVWIVSEWRPSFKFDRKVTKELFGYGKHILGASIIIFFITNIDDAIVGRVLGMESLGFYTLAYTISNLPATQITHLIGRVMFPTYSKLQDDREALRNAYMKTLRFVSTVSIPASLGILVIAPEFVYIVLGQKWMPSVPALQLLCIFGLTRSIAATFGPIYQATGKPQILKNYSLLQLIILLISIYPLTSIFGIVGAALATVIALLLTIFLHFDQIGKILNQKVILLFKAIVPPLVFSLIMASSILLLKRIFIVQSVLDLTLLIAYGAIVYFLLNYFANREIYYEIKQILL